MAEPPKLSQDELVKVLQKAAERETREGPRSFTAEEAIQAGRELGLSAGNVQAELERLHARKASGALAERRPFDTKITVASADHRFLLTVPARGVHGAALGMLAFSGLWLSFVAFWTKQALSIGGSGPFAAFSLPFWLVGLGMVGGAIRSMLGSQQLELTREGGVLRSLPRGRTHRLRTSELRVRLDRIKQRRNQNAPEIEVPVLALEHGTRTFHLLGHHSESEQRWVKSELELWLQQQG